MSKYWNSYCSVWMVLGPQFVNYCGRRVVPSNRFVEFMKQKVEGDRLLFSPRRRWRCRIPAGPLSLPGSSRLLIPLAVFFTLSLSLSFHVYVDAHYRTTTGSQSSEALQLLTLSDRLQAVAVTLLEVQTRVQAPSFRPRPEKSTITVHRFFVRV
jgi:hypothetical protein